MGQTLLSIAFLPTLGCTSRIEARAEGRCSSMPLDGDAGNVGDCGQQRLRYTRTPLHHVRRCRVLAGAHLRGNSSVDESWRSSSVVGSQPAVMCQRSPSRVQFSGGNFDHSITSSFARSRKTILVLDFLATCATASMTFAPQCSAASSNAMTNGKNSAWWHGGVCQCHLHVSAGGEGDVRALLSVRAEWRRGKLAKDFPCYMSRSRLSSSCPERDHSVITLTKKSSLAHSHPSLSYLYNLEFPLQHANAPAFSLLLIRLPYIG